MNLVTSYDSNKNMHRFYRGKDCTEKLCKDLKDPAMEVINAEKKEMIPLIDDEKVYREKRKYYHICKREFYNDEESKYFKKYHKVRDHDHYTEKYRGAAHSIRNLRYKT